MGAFRSGSSPVSSVKLSQIIDLTNLTSSNIPWKRNNRHHPEVSDLVETCVGMQWGNRVEITLGIDTLSQILKITHPTAQAAQGNSGFGTCNSGSWQSPVDIACYA